MQREITEKCRVFEDNGEVKVAGWARNGIFDYNKADSKTSNKHSERDCYFISNNEVALYVSVENLGMEFAIKISVADLKRGGEISDCVIKKFVLFKNELPESGNNGELIYTDKRIQLQFTNTTDGRFLKCDFIDFGGLKNLYFNINLKKINGESLNELAPFERDRRYFYYKRFVPEFIASGVIRVGGLEYSLNESDSLAYFDFTRFSKPRKHQYQRLSSNCFVDGKRFALCLASRVGDNRYGNENSFFIDGKLEKLSQINVNGTNGRLDRPWKFTAGISAVDIIFKPFTIKGKPMISVMDNTKLIYGRLYGEIKRVDYNDPIVLDNALAHMLLTEF